MTDSIEELITTELLSIISKEILEEYDKVLSEKLIKKISSCINRVSEQSIGFDFYSIYNCFYYEDGLYKLKKTRILFSLIIDNTDDLQAIDKLRLKNPDNKLYIYMWLYLKIEIFQFDEYFAYELVDFIKEISNKHDWLLNLNGFFSETPIFKMLEENNVLLRDEVLTLFEEANKKYSKNTELNSYLISVYIIRDEFSKAIDMLDLSLNLIGKTDKNYKNHESFFIRRRAEVYFESGDYEKALIDANYKIEQKENGLSFDSLIAYLIRISINLKKKNIKQSDSDCFKLINSIGVSRIFSALSDYYPDANNYMEQYIEKLAKKHTTKYDEETNNKIFKMNSGIGKIEISGNEDWEWEWDSDMAPFFDIKFTGKETKSIKIPEPTNDNLTQNIEVLYDAKLTKEQEKQIANWLRSPSALSKKNIGIKTTNYKYISIVWDFLNAKNSIADISIIYLEDDEDDEI